MTPGLLENSPKESKVSNVNYQANVSHIASSMKFNPLKPSPSLTDLISLRNRILGTKKFQPLRLGKYNKSDIYETHYLGLYAPNFQQYHDILTMHGMGLNGQALCSSHLFALGPHENHPLRYSDKYN